MTDPRVLLDNYGRRTLRGVPNEVRAPKAFAALRAVLDLHPPSTLTAGVLPERFGPGRCAFCHLGAPIREYRDRPWPEKPELDMHEHTDLHPWCFACAGPEEETSQSWPCPTVRAITTALEAK